MSLIKIQPESVNMCILLICFLYFTGDSQSFAISSDLPIVPADENRGVYESELPKKKVQIGKNVLY